MWVQCEALWYVLESCDTQQQLWGVGSTSLACSLGIDRMLGVPFGLHPACGLGFTLRRCMIIESPAHIRTETATSNSTRQTSSNQVSCVQGTHCSLQGCQFTLFCGPHAS